MNVDYNIVSFSYIDSHRVIVDGIEIFTNPNEANFANFISALYKHLKIDYPKFFKMDNLSKLGLLASEILLKDKEILKPFLPENIGIVLANKTSSLDTDLKFNELITDDMNYYPSPSVFVYTLSNIVAGEICIRNYIKGENYFFIFEKFDPIFLHNYVKTLFDKNKIEACMVGWINLIGEDYESFIIFVDNKKKDSESVYNKQFTVENIGHIYQSLHGTNY